VVSYRGWWVAKGDGLPRVVVAIEIAQALIVEEAGVCVILSMSEPHLRACDRISRQYSSAVHSFLVCLGLK
jgi:hypothetical protein